MTAAKHTIFQKFNKIREEGDGMENKVRNVLILLMSIFFKYANIHIQVEVREDEEQSVKLQEIIDLLVAAGYFRARIKGLSPFDKVVGGMTWCIESCTVDIDVNLLFLENSTIGQKM